ncbi:hypothetical protein GBA65_17535 [Rubrobacter marinus]|uniref:Uncharacterized protein n=1 Tax=Rubrobacter marinus TaxID=2653852 RepID=A0A6G8Q0L3_9ACTN|nr:hypothetical protein [Rubrobacter marinus]QIN80029.1 hypothetical protein GBA65_17535 [Rubrobacter marinus]
MVRGPDRAGSGSERPRSRQALVEIRERHRNALPESRARPIPDALLPGERRRIHEAPSLSVIDHRGGDLGWKLLVMSLETSW